MASVNYGYGKLEDGAISYAPVELVVDGKVTINPSAASYAACGWLPVRDEPPTPATGYHNVATGWEERDVAIWRVYTQEADAPIYRKFSKLKIYGAIVSLPDANGTTAWEVVKSWLEAKTINGVNGWMAFQLAQEISEDNEMFSALAEEARQLLGLTAEQFEALLAQCVLEGN